MKPVEAKDIYTYDWVFQNHKPKELRRWVSALQYISFVRAFGGHASDYDEFVVYLQFANEADLHQLMNDLGMKLRRIRPGDLVPEPGVSYTGDAWAALASPIPEFPQYNQPGKVEIQGIPVFMYVVDHHVMCTFSGQDPAQAFDVSEIDFNNALRFDRLISELGLAPLVDNAIKKRAGCITLEKLEALIRTNEHS